VDLSRATHNYLTLLLNFDLFQQLLEVKESGYKWAISRLARDSIFRARGRQAWTFRPVMLHLDWSKQEVHMHLPSIGIVGLGIMGGAMAESLLASGYSVSGYDPRGEARTRLAIAGGKVLQSTTEVADYSDILITSLPSTEALRETTQSLCAAKPRTRKRALLILETSTFPIADKNHAQLALRQSNINLMDCPINGVAVRIRDRTWTIFASGEKRFYERAAPVLQVFTDDVPYVGDFGNGTRLKFCSNHLVAIYNVAYAESIALARKMGLDPQQVLGLFGDSPVIGTDVMRVRMPLMIQRKYLPPTMKVEVWQKDMQVIGDMARSVSCPLPLFSACIPIYSSAMAQGWADQDTASVSEVLSDMAGLPLKAKRTSRTLQVARKVPAATTRK
jgi:putative dehydrogenase